MQETDFETQPKFLQNFLSAASQNLRRVRRWQDSKSCRWKALLLLFEFVNENGRAADQKRVNERTTQPFQRAYFETLKHIARDETHWFELAILYIEAAAGIFVPLTLLKSCEKMLELGRARSKLDAPAECDLSFFLSCG
jgi:hypothetical protein